MSSTALIWLLINLLSIAVLSFYSMIEMACVSFNKVRLQYYVSQNDERALLLNNMLHHSFRLFGTTLIGVNVAMMCGSEFSRLFHSAIGLSPDLAPLSQVLLVVIFGELAPMFAARRYAESVVMLGIKALNASAILMSPVLWTIKHMTQIVHSIFGGPNESGHLYLSQEELQKLIGEKDEKPGAGSSEELNLILSNIFGLREKVAWQVMTPLYMVPMIPATCTIANLKKILQNTQHPYLPIYEKALTNVVGIALPRDLIPEPDHLKVKDKARQPWFISQNAPLFHILKQFKRNHQSLAVVLDKEGLAVGILSLEDVIDEIFGKEGISTERSESKGENLLLIERTFDGTTKIEEFNKAYNVNLDAHGCQNLAELVVAILGHSPEEGDTVSIPPFELKVKDASLLEVKSITIRTKV